MLVENVNFMKKLTKASATVTVCYGCKRSLPKCSLCLLSMGAVNPIIEQTYQRHKEEQSKVEGDLMEALSMGKDVPMSLESKSVQAAPARVLLPFDEAWTWCQSCR